MARRSKQLEIEGTQRVEHPEVEEAAEELRALRSERMLLQEREAAAKDTLLSAMTSHNIPVYRYVDPEGIERRVEVVNKQNAKISKVKQSDDSSSAQPDSGGDVEVH